MKNKINIVHAFRKTRLVYTIGNSNDLYHIDIKEVGDPLKPEMGFKCEISDLKKFKLIKGA